MAVTTQIMMDTRYKTISKYTCAAAANTTVSLLDVSTLQGYETVCRNQCGRWYSKPS